MFPNLQQVYLNPVDQFGPEPSCKVSGLLAVADASPPRAALSALWRGMLQLASYVSLQKTVFNGISS